MDLRQRFSGEQTVAGLAFVFPAQKKMNIRVSLRSISRSPLRQRITTSPHLPCKSYIGHQMRDYSQILQLKLFFGKFTKPSKFVFFATDSFGKLDFFRTQRLLFFFGNPHQVFRYSFKKKKKLEFGKIPLLNR